MAIKPQLASPVNPSPLARLGQSVRVLSRDTIGVVVGLRGTVVELAVWPSRRLAVTREDIRHLTSGDACPRSLELRAATEALVAGNRCMPRARDGRCHWCDRLLDEAHEDASEADHG